MLCEHDARYNNMGNLLFLFSDEEYWRKSAR